MDSFLLVIRSFISRLFRRIVPSSAPSLIQSPVFSLRSSLLPALLVPLLSFGMVSKASAASITNTNTGITWDTNNAGWNTATATPWDSVNGSNNSAVFNTSGSTTITETVAATGITIGQLYYGGNNGINTTTMMLGGGTITLGAKTNYFTLGNYTNASATNTMKMVISNVLAGSGMLYLTRTVNNQNTAIFTLPTNNTYTGGTTLGAGMTINFYSGGIFGQAGTSILDFGNINLSNLSGSSVTFSNYNWNPWLSCPHLKRCVLASKTLPSRPKSLLMQWSVTG